MNLTKHGLDFADARQVLESKAVLIVKDDRYDYGEVRLIAYGPLKGRICMVVYARQADAVRSHPDIARIISFRKANRREVKRYEESRKASG